MKTLIVSIRYLLMMTAIAGIIYPIFITIFAQVIFPCESNGSMLQYKGENVGSKLIGQSFSETGYFNSRPSATNYDPFPSGATNFSLTNEKIQLQYKYYKNEFILKNYCIDKKEVPSEMLFASASGLDPHISIESAIFQINRIADFRDLNTIQRRELIAYINSIHSRRQFGFLGEPVVNVLMLNIGLDLYFPSNKK